VPTLPNLPPKTSTKLDDVMSIMGDVLGLPGSTFQWRGHNPPRSSSVGVPLVTSCLSPMQTPLSGLCPCWGLSIHLVGSLAPWRSKLIISPCVPVQHGTCPSGIILHINSYALHGLISHRDHSNVNHISSSILLNMCIKPLLPQLKSSKTLYKPAIQVWRK
jgi:hypothetical protein